MVGPGHLDGLYMVGPGHWDSLYMVGPGHWNGLYMWGPSSFITHIVICRTEGHLSALVQDTV